MLYQLFPDPVKSRKIVCSKMENFLGMLTANDIHYRQFALEHLYLLLTEKEQLHGDNYLSSIFCMLSTEKSWLGPKSFLPLLNIIKFFWPLFKCTI